MIESLSIFIDPLSSFAINIASGIAINIYDSKNSKIDNEIKSAFNLSLKRWSKNKAIRERYRRNLSNYLSRKLNRSELNDYEIDDQEFKSFFEIFETELSSKQTAYNYLKKIEDRSQFQSILKEIGYVKDFMNKIENLRIDSPIELVFTYGILEESSFNLIFEEYYQTKLELFDSQEWPYHIDKTVFVNVFDFKYGTIAERNNLQHDSRCVENLYDKIKKEHCFCLGYYGMGKTTISKFLFQEILSDKTEKTFHISLTHKSLPDQNNLIDYLFNELENNIKNHNFLLQFNKVYIKYRLTKMINSGELKVIFDGLDESNHTSSSLVSFGNSLSSIKLFMLTCRLEFTSFFTTYQSIFRNSYVLELKEWNSKQWDTYLQALIEKYPGISIKKVSEFKVDLPTSLSDLAKRPLFFRMITDLFLLNENELNIPTQLKNNIAVIYYEFIQWKIIDDIKKRHSVLRDRNYNEAIFRTNVFNLFKEIAIKEYSTLDQEENSKALDITKIKEALQKVDFFEIDDRQILNIFLSSTLFSTISQTEDSFKFSHKSFYEYLVANVLASDLFENNHLSDVWDLYQTYEVSNHFQGEVERRLYLKKKKSIQEIPEVINTLLDAIKDFQDFEDFSEKVEEVLYYLGKYEVKKSSLLNKLNELTNGERKVIPVYIRTAYITYGRLGEIEKLEEFVKKLIIGFSTKSDLYEHNLKEDLKYYGDNNIRSKLEKYVNNYIEKGQKNKLNVLRIFSYFTSQSLGSKSILNTKFSDVFNRAHSDEDEKMISICNGIKNIIQIKYT